MFAVGKVLREEFLKYLEIVKRLVLINRSFYRMTLKKRMKDYFMCYVIMNNIWLTLMYVHCVSTIYFQNRQVQRI